MSDSWMTVHQLYENCCEARRAAEGKLAAMTPAIHRLRRAVDNVLKAARLGEYEGQTKNDHELIDAARALLALTPEEPET